MDDQLDNQLIAFGGAIKALDEDGRIGGYLVAFGGPKDKDLQGEYFTPETDFHLDDYPVVGERTLYHHGLDKTLGVKAIGKITSMKMDEIGMWVEAELKKADAYARAIFEMVKQGKLGWSSGALPQSYRAANDGHILSWAVQEGSLTPTPAQPRKTAIQSLNTLKALAADATGIDAFIEADQPEEAPAPVDSSDVVPDASDPSRLVGTDTGALPTQSVIKSEQPPDTQEQNMDVNILSAAAETAVATVLEGTKMTLGDTERQQFVAQAAEVLGKMMPADEVEDAHGEMMKAIASSEFVKQLGEIAVGLTAVRNQQIRDAMKANVAGLSQPVSRVNGYQASQNGSAQTNGRISDVRTKFHDLSAEDMAYLHMIRKEVAKRRSDYDYRPDPLFVREAFDKAQKAYQGGKILLDAVDDAQTVKALNTMKANELDHSTQTGYGDEWVPNVWSADLWLRARMDNVVFSRIRSIDMPSNPFELPVESTDPTVYKVAEATAETELALDNSSSLIPDSKVATTKVTLTAAKLGLRVGVSAEVEEDSIIPFIANSRRQSIRAISDSIDNVLLNGDTATTLNVNSDGETISDTSRKYLVFNGMIKNPIVTATSNAVSASGAAPTLAMLRSVRSKLPAAKGTRVSELAWFVDYSTYMKMLAIDEISSAANRGTAPTGVTGILNAIDGVDLYVSAEMALADTDGKVTQTANATDTGRALLVHLPSWIAGFRRRVMSSISFLPYYDSYQMVATVRLALAVQDNDSTAILYNVGI